MGYPDKTVPVTGREFFDAFGNHVLVALTQNGLWIAQVDARKREQHAITLHYGAFGKLRDALNAIAIEAPPSAEQADGTIAPDALMDEVKRRSDALVEELKRGPPVPVTPPPSESLLACIERLLTWYEAGDLDERHLAERLRARLDIEHERDRRP